MPKSLCRPQSVLIGDVVFTADIADDDDVMRYDTRSDQWSVLPHCPVKHFGLGQLYGKLIAVSKCENSTDVYIYEEDTQLWTWDSTWEKPIPKLTPMPYVVSYHSKIVVFPRYSKEVWVFNGDTSQWYRAAPLPFPCQHLTQATVINDICYIGGDSQSIIRASMLDLLQSTDQQSFAQQQSVWTNLPYPPNTYMTLTNTGGTLLALGGFKTSSPLPNDAIHAYSPSTKSWLKIGTLPQGVSHPHATAEVLASGELVIVTTPAGATYIGKLEL